jgi:hypothetical protein
MTLQTEFEMIKINDGNRQKDERQFVPEEF